MHVHRHKVKRMEKNQSSPAGLACKACNLPPPARWESLTGSCSCFQDLQTVGIYEKKKKTKHFWRSRRTRKCFSTITTKSRTIQTDESSTPQNTEVCTKKKRTQIRTKTRDALHPCLGNLEVWMPPFAHMNLGEIRLHLGSTVAVLKKTTAIYHSTISYQLINMLSATLHQHLKETIHVQINLMT